MEAIRFSLHQEDNSQDGIDHSRSRSIPWWTIVIVRRLMSWRSTPRSILIDVGYFSIHLNNEITNPTKQDVYQAEWIASSDTWRSDNFIWLLHSQTERERERVTIINLHSSRFLWERETREQIFILPHCTRENRDHPLVGYVSWFSSCASLNIDLSLEANRTSSILDTRCIQLCNFSCWPHRRWSLSDYLASQRWQTLGRSPWTK